MAAERSGNKELWSLVFFFFFQIYTGQLLYFFSRFISLYFLLICVFASLTDAVAKVVPLGSKCWQSIGCLISCKPQCSVVRCCTSVLLMDRIFHRSMVVIVRWWSGSFRAVIYVLLCMMVGRLNLQPFRCIIYTQIDRDTDRHVHSRRESDIWQKRKIYDLNANDWEQRKITFPRSEIRPLWIATGSHLDAITAAKLGTSLF